MPARTRSRTAPTRPSVTAFQQRLEAGGLIDKHTNPEDVRSYRVVLTAAGRAAHERGMRDFVEGWTPIERLRRKR